MNLLQNLFSVTYYTSILSGKQKFRLFLAALILALVVSIRPSFFILQKVYPLVQNLENKIMTVVDDVYPEELEVKIKNGYVSTNVTEPYYITIRQEQLESILSLQEDKQIAKSKVRLLAIDTKGKAEEFERYQSMALLTQTSLVYYQDGKTNIQSLRDIRDLTVNRELIKSKIKEYNKDNIIGNLLAFFVLFSPLIIIIGGFLGQLIKFLFLSLLVYLMVRINQLPTGFKNTFRYTAAVTFIVMILANIISFIPQVASNILAIEAVLTMIILGLAYCGINLLKNAAPQPNLAVVPLPSEVKEITLSGGVEVPIPPPTVSEPPPPVSTPEKPTVSPTPYLRKQLPPLSSTAPPVENYQPPRPYTFSTLSGNISAEDAQPAPWEKETKD